MTNRRANGCAKPYNSSQLAAWFGQPLVLGWFAAWFGVFSSEYGGSNNNESKTFVIVISILWTLLVSIGIILWLACQLLDPSITKDNVRLCCIPTRAHEVRYCALCKKSVPGLDHHCPWLGTCVGTRTYLSFFLLVLDSAMVYMLQIIVFALLMSSSNIRLIFNEVLVYVVCAIGIAMSFPIAGFHTLLFLFHVHLQMEKMTTYDWFLARDKRKREAKKKAREKAAASSSSQQQQQQQPNHNGSSTVTKFSSKDTNNNNNVTASNTAAAPIPTTNNNANNSSSTDGVAKV
jgi:hypothetical protein